MLIISSIIQEKRKEGPLVDLSVCCLRLPAEVQCNVEVKCISLGIAQPSFPILALPHSSSAIRATRQPLWVSVSSFVKWD